MIDSVPGFTERRVGRDGSGFGASTDRRDRKRTLGGGWVGPGKFRQVSFLWRSWLNALSQRVPQKGYLKGMRRPGETQECWKSAQASKGFVTVSGAGAKGTG